MNRVGLSIRNEDEILKASVFTGTHKWVSKSYQISTSWTHITVTWKKEGEWVYVLLGVRLHKTATASAPSMAPTSRSTSAIMCKWFH